jgi:vanillate/4-hydroxybenzoate decarboxylase subunit C
MPALSFEKIKGYKNARIVTNIHGSWPNHALIMGMPKDSETRAQFFEFVKRYQQYPGKVERVKDPPWMENVIDKDVNLFDIMPLLDSTSTRPVSSAGIPMISKTMKSRMSACIGSR